MSVYPSISLLICPSFLYLYYHDYKDVFEKGMLIIAHKVFRPLL